ncbi:MATE family efflux transporter [Citrobacter sedlakii]|uniref:MATE family efflux transporter n=1 Tax=Citrobacter sedlakii TaxID=67826 RepID=UPI003B2463C7
MANKIQLLRGNVLIINALSNYIAAGWLGISNIILMPIYLKMLGPTQWGIVSLCIAVQAFMFLVDAGLAQIMPRDIAKEKNHKGLLSVFLTYNYLYIIIAFFVFIVGYIALPYIISHWFNEGIIQKKDLYIALKLLLIQFVFQLVNNSNLCYWYGIQKQHIACARQIIFFSIKHFLALILIFYWDNTAVSYQLSFFVVTAIECLLNRHAVMKDLKGKQDYRFVFNFTRITSLFKESGVLSFAILLGMFTTQIDKILLSKQVTLENFGYYSIIAFLGAAFLQLQYPLMRAFLPKLASEKQHSNLLGYVTMLKFILLFCVFPTILAIIFADKILLIWLHNEEIASFGVGVLRLILLATVINGFYNIIYQRIIIFGDGRYILLINATCLLLVFPVTYILSLKIGVLAGGVAWLLTAVIQLTLGLFWALKKSKKL